MSRGGCQSGDIVEKQFVGDGELVSAHVGSTATAAAIRVVPRATAIPARGIDEWKCGGVLVVAHHSATSAAGVDEQGFARSHRDGRSHATAQTTEVAVYARGSALRALRINLKPGDTGGHGVRLRDTGVIEVAPL